MTNSPEMVVAILALAKLGVVVDLINTNHRGEYAKNSSTVHSLTQISSLVSL